MSVNFCRELMAEATHGEPNRPQIQCRNPASLRGTALGALRSLLVVTLPLLLGPHRAGCFTSSASSIILRSQALAGEPHGGATPVLRLMAELEDRRHAALHKGSFLCSWRADPYDSVAPAKGAGSHKARTNALFCDALGGIAGEQRLGSAKKAANSDDWIVVLDGKRAVTCKHLVERGVPLEQVLVPNLYTSTVASLRQHGVENAFCCDVDDLLRLWPAQERRIKAAWLGMLKSQQTLSFNCGLIINASSALTPIALPGAKVCMHESMHLN